VEVQVLPIEKPSASKRAAEPGYVVEPGPAAVLEALLPHYLEVMLYWLVVEAYTSEQAARLSAMQNAKSNAQDTADSLTLVYNTTRQERITSEILDLANQEIGT
jgi:F-type H+-transporting ATPase subunit gamma